MNTLPSLLCYCLSAPPPACQFKPKLWNKGRPWGTSGSSRFSHRRKPIWGMSATPSCFDLWSGSPLHTCGRSPGSLRAGLGLPYWRTAVNSPSCLQAVIVLRGVGLVPVCSGLPPSPRASMGEATVSCKSRWHRDMWG